MVDTNTTIEVVCVPVSDVDRAKAFYAEEVGFRVDFDSPSTSSSASSS
jgi:catechol 2,3-dioxygenase-like lactoylglutathione lyase family enzyme